MSFLGNVPSCDRKPLLPISPLSEDTLDTIERHTTGRGVCVIKDSILLPTSLLMLAKTVLKIPFAPFCSFINWVTGDKPYKGKNTSEFMKAVKCCTLSAVVKDGIRTAMLVDRFVATSICFVVSPPKDDESATDIALKTNVLTISEVATISNDAILGKHQENDLSIADHFTYWQSSRTCWSKLIADDKILFDITRTGATPNGDLYKRLKRQSSV